MQGRHGLVGRTFGIAYTKEPKGLTEEEADSEVVVRKIMFAFANKVNWIWRVV